MYILKSQKYASKDNYVEVLGMPSSGKTTLVGNMKKNDPGSIDVNASLPKSKFGRQAIKLLYMAQLFMRSPRAFVRDTKIILSSGQKNTKDLYSVLSNWHLNARLYALKNDADHLYIWDQGLFQAVWSIYFCGSKEFDAIELFENKLLPGKVHFADASDAELVRRSRNRSRRMRLNYLNQGELEKGRYALEKTMHLIEEIGYIEKQEST
ncbi:hypothetical protein C8U37_102123 [Trichococcus patagoniensis]|uniref:Uncharacterized protein n=1 Tax=Trichococcus patagoniensis TaxID=382641 RepID=A0A2T5IQF4_9LACT|nr:hypothetical protein [Trichococcus patagoniensis]PTQ86020.1 hypothetical protein C8U37_102123 [Trichococcus patagoniensis]